MLKTYFFITNYHPFISSLNLSNQGIMLILFLKRYVQVGYIIYTFHVSIIKYVPLSGEEGIGLGSACRPN